MKLDAIKSLLVDRYERRAAKLRPLYLEGPAGIGKTEIVRQAAEQIGVPCVVVCLSAMEAADFSGLPMVDPKTGDTRYARPNWLPDGPAVVFFDEVNRAGIDTLQPLLTLLQDRHINGHAVHPGTMFVLAGNPASAEYNTQELDKALRDRLATLKVEADYAGLQVLMAQRYPGSTLEMQWLVQQANLSPRSVEFTLRAIEGTKRDSAHYLALLTAELGAEGAGALVAWTKKQKRLSIDQLEFTKDGATLTAETRKLVADTWAKGEEAIPVFTSLAKDLIAKFNAEKDGKEQRKKLLAMLNVSDATGDKGCASIYMDLYNEVSDKSVLATHVFELAAKKNPALDQYRALLKADIDSVVIQKSE